MSLQDRSPTRLMLGHALAFVLVAIALLVTLGLGQYLSRTTALLFWPAVILAALYGGTGPGVVAAVLSAVALEFFFYSPARGLGPGGLAGWLSLALFVVIAALLAWLTNRVRQAELDARAAADIAESRAAELSEKTELLEQQATELEAQTEEAQSLTEELEQSSESLERLAREAEDARDVADRERARIRQVFDTLPDSTSVFDHDWRWTYMNPRAEQRMREMGRDPASMIGRVIWEEYPELRETKFYTESLRAQRENRMVEYEEHYAALDLWAEARVVPSADGIVGYSRDITERKRAESALRDSEARFRTLFVDNPLPMWVLDDAGTRFLDVNDAAVRGYGWTREEFLCLSPGAMCPQESATCPGDGMQQVDPGGSGAGGTPLHRRKDGSLLSVDLTSREIRFRDRPARLVIAVDVTARLEAAERISRLQRVTAALAHALTVEEVASTIVEEGGAALDARSGVFCLVTPDKQSLEIVRSFNMKEQVTSQFRRFPIAAPLPLSDAVRMREAVFLENRGAALSRYPQLASANVQETAEAWLAVPFIADGEALGGLTFGFDADRPFTDGDREFVQALARQCAIALERARLLGAERDARSDAETANRAKTDFLAVMSHELRTPLNAIAGHTELVQLGIHGPVTDAQIEALERVQRSQRHLLGLINDVLNFAKLEAGHVEIDIRDVDLAQTILAIEPLISTQLRAKALRYDHDACAERRMVRADPEKLQQILLNLLSNATKFTPDGGTVSVSCGTAGPGRVCIEVRDTGVGIAPDRLESIFAPFVQVNRRLSSPHEGTGLGLAISRDLARAMDGDVTVESTPGVGSCFRVVLPSSVS